MSDNDLLILASGLIAAVLFIFKAPLMVLFDPKPTKTNPFVELLIEFQIFFGIAYVIMCLIYSLSKQHV